MDQSTITQASASTHEQLRLFCNECHNITRHAAVRDPFEEDKENGDVISWQIVQCAGCESITFYLKRRCEEDQDLSDEHTYPPRQYRTPRHFVNAPAKLDELYVETVQAYNNLSLLFCAGGLRALVEGICDNQNVTNGPRRNEETGEYVVKRDGTFLVSNTLDCKIEGLAQKGILTARAAKTLHEHRYLGNKALHALEKPTREMLDVAINLIEFIMQDLYSIEAQAGELEKRRKGL